MNSEKNRKMDDLERARMLRREAELLENRERVRSRLKKLMEISQDPFYDRYLAQMWKDLENGKATPWQVEQEAERSYRQYRQRMQMMPAPGPTGQAPLSGRVHPGNVVTSEPLPGWVRPGTAETGEPVPIPPYTAVKGKPGPVRPGQSACGEALSDPAADVQAVRQESPSVREELRTASEIPVSVPEEAQTQTAAGEELQTAPQSLASVPEEAQEQAVRQEQVSLCPDLTIAREVSLPAPACPQEDFSRQPAGAFGGSGHKEKGQNNLEFRIGVHVFSIIGAVFVLAAFVIFGFQFLGGVWQGMSLYGAALLPVILPELFAVGRARRAAGRFSLEGQEAFSEKPGRGGAGLPSRISCVVTGIGIGGLYVANIVNYLVLHTINGFEAMATVLAIAAGAIFLGRKKDSALIRIISLIGCYLCIFSVGSFESKLDFLVITLMLFVINTAGVLFQNQKNQTAINIVHMILTLIFTCVITFKARLGESNALYLVLQVVTSFVFLNIMSLKACVKEKTALFPMCCVGNGFCVFLLFLIGNFEPQVSSDAELALFVHLTAQVLILAVCLVTFMLWDKEDGRRWAQLYYGVSVVILLGTFSDYNLEILICVLLAFLVVKLCAGQKEVFFLDCVMVAWVGIFWCGFTVSWPCWLFAAALFLSAFRIKRGYLYHEFVITVALLLIWWVQCRYDLQERVGLNGGWLYPVSAGIMLVLFLLFNHLPGLKNKNQQPYNISSLVVMSMYYLMVWSWHSYVFSTIMMVSGAVTILIVFRKRYAMEIPRKYLVLAGFLVWFSLTGHYSSPVVVSILLMVIALGCVGVGFRLQDKVERICGLVMAFFVCVKLVLYDFREVEAMYRVLVFLVVGVLALIISCIYIRLEKRQISQ